MFNCFSQTMKIFLGDTKIELEVRKFVVIQFLICEWNRSAGRICNQLNSILISCISSVSIKQTSLNSACRQYVIKMLIWPYKNSILESWNSEIQTMKIPTFIDCSSFIQSFNFNPYSVYKCSCFLCLFILLHKDDFNSIPVRCNSSTSRNSNWMVSSNNNSNIRRATTS